MLQPWWCGGSSDPIVGQSWAERVAGLLPRGELRILPGVGHTANFTAPKEFAAVIAQFLGLDRKL